MAFASPFPLASVLLMTSLLQPEIAPAQTIDPVAVNAPGLAPLFSSAQPPEKVRIRLKNNGLVPREFKFVTRCPDEKYPDVFTTYLLPGAVYKADFKIGTSIAQVTQAEINATMKGRFVPGKPLLVVKADDGEKTVNLIQ